MKEWSGAVSVRSCHFVTIPSPVKPSSPLTQPCPFLECYFYCSRISVTLKGVGKRSDLELNSCSFIILAVTSPNI